MKSRKLLGRHVCGSMMVLSADLVWYGLGRWRGPQALELLGRLSPKPRTFIRRAQSGFLANVGLFQLSSRFLPSSIRSRPALPARRGSASPASSATVRSAHWSGWQPGSA